MNFFHPHPRPMNIGNYSRLSWRGLWVCAPVAGISWVSG